MNIINYFAMNIFLILISFFSYNGSLLINYLIHVFKTFTIMFFIAYVQRNKVYITHRICQITVQSFFNFLVTMFIETCTHQIIINYYDLQHTNIFYDFVTFIPKSFLFELIYDFIHYWIHRISHTNKFLYANFHCVHHSKIAVTLVDTYYQHPFDFILSNSIPLLISTYIINLSVYQFTSMMVYKSVVEISGHTGKSIKQRSFPQFPWLSYCFDFALCTEDHDVHHRYFNCNFSKRFSIWDKIFDTYR